MNFAPTTTERGLDRRSLPWIGWLPLATLPALALWWGAAYSRWVLMWATALAIGVGCKWLTWWADRRAADAPWVRQLGYLVAWPGMNAREFLDRAIIPPRPAKKEWISAGSLTVTGAVMIWVIARQVPTDLAAGWVGLAGIAFLLHFGSFRLLSVAWRNAGVLAQPIMRAPLLATSVAEFWNSRWNLPFNELVGRYVFVPTVRRWGGAVSCLIVFLLSGLIHELVISVPAGGGYGWPTAYFMVQGSALLFERSRFGRRAGLRRGWRGRAFTVAVTAGPAFWLFSPIFIRNVILPMLHAIGAT